ncbi:MAG: extracellular solute-binding protein [Methylocystis sp.]|nr:extracellular solute-binding protein [Methylocystis sp.]MCA3582608.1 extracellular solute-binding protein [Methylocystis sp.]MCA3589594.1 extracellular solute-binding protein [Methylocystis sp.]MCA3591719.1 extracellular solute-binding protein [Methylocystis sp.]
MGILSRFLGAAVVAALSISPAKAQQLTVWHDLGDNGIKWFEAMGAEFAKTKPGVTVRSLSFPTDQWFGRVISALNTDTAPNLIFNNYERVIRIQNQTGKVMDLKAALAAVNDKAFLSEDDLRVATFKGRQIIIPIQRVQMAFGVRKSWLDKNGGKFPDNWDEVKVLAVAFRDKDPDGNGQADTFGMALQAAKPRDLIHMLDLFTFGSGLRHTLIDPDGKITIDQPAHAQVLEEFLKTYSTHKFVAPDTINHSFGEMYQVIEGGRGGMFRVGDWNVKKWDGANVLNGDFVSGPWPKFAADRENAVVIGGMRGIAVPENAPNKALAIEFAQFMLSKPAQQASLENVGAAVRKDLDVSTLSPRSQYFAKAGHKLVAYDFPESIHSFYPELEAAFHRKLLSGISNPPADWKAFIAETAKEMRELAAKLKG